MEIKADELRRAQSMVGQGRQWEGMPANDEQETPASFAGLVLCIAGFDVLVLGGLWGYMYAPTVAGWWAELLKMLGLGA